jgi:hypothetical protein
MIWVKSGNVSGLSSLEHDVYIVTPQKETMAASIMILNCFIVILRII